MKRTFIIYNKFHVKTLENVLEMRTPNIFNTDQGVQLTSNNFRGWS